VSKNSQPFYYAPTGIGEQSGYSMTLAFVRLQYDVLYRAGCFPSGRPCAIAFSGDIEENADQIRSGNDQDPGQIGIEIDETGLTDDKWQLVNERPA